MIYITVAGYVLVAAMLLCGMKYAGKGKFHADSTTLEVTKCLQGVTAVCVMLHHISQSNAYRETKTLAAFPEIGPLFVGIFFFCSGFGLIKSMQTKPDYLKTFMHKRLPTILVPFYTMTIAYGLFNLAIGRQMPVMQWILSATGLVLMNSHAWYAVVITLLYIAFYYIFKNAKSERTAYILMAHVIGAQLVFSMCWGHFAWWAGEPYWWKTPTGWANAQWWMAPSTLWFQGEWWVNATLAMMFGMLFARNEKAVTAWMQKDWLIKTAALAVAFAGTLSLSLYTQHTVSFWSEFGAKNSIGIGNKFICLVPQVASVIAFVMLIFAIMMKLRTTNPVISFLGKRTYEIYLMHNIFLMGALPLISTIPDAYGNATPIINAQHMAMYAGIVIAGGILLGTLFHWINGLIVKKIAR